MDILLCEDSTVAFISENITYGKVDPSEPNRDKWKINDHLFALGEFTLVKNVEVPSNVVPEKHMYVNGAFQINPAWKEPVTVESLQHQITDLQLIIATLIEGGTV